MVHTALLHILDLVNQHFKNEFSAPEIPGKAALSNIVNADGSIPDELDDKIVFFLVGLEEEASLKNNFNRSSSDKGGSLAKKPPALHFNMQVLFCANFVNSQYKVGLAYLSSLIRYFQTNKTINIPNLPRKLDFDNIAAASNASATNVANPAWPVQRVSFELCKLDYSELSHLWSAIGSKLMPSVLYKVRVVVFDDSPSRGTTPPVKATQTTA